MALFPARAEPHCAHLLTTLHQTWEDEMKGGGCCCCWWCRWRWREETREHEIEIPGERRVTAGLRIKQRAVTTQEAAAEDDRSAGLQIGSVGVRGQLMSTHSKQASEPWRCEIRSSCTWDPQVASLLSSRQVTVTTRGVQTRLPSNKLQRALQDLHTDRWISIKSLTILLYYPMHW